MGLVWNEVSRRYVDEEPEFWFPDVWRGKPVNAKQGSSGIIPSAQPDVDLDMYVQMMQAYAAGCYQELLKHDVAPEQARMVLPQNTMTEFIWSGSLAAFARVCKLRLDPHAQEETRQVAQQLNDLVPQELGHSWKALLN